jgi:KUP system potassium uptake protein
MQTETQQSTHSSQLALTIAALGVVFGDIGTSPLYALKESFHHSHNISLDATSIFGVLSLIFWSLIIVISIKYVFFILKADNKGEGGILALTNLVTKNGRKSKLLIFGLFGTALLYGDGMITPAISVLSAVEGLSLITPVFDPYIIPITIFILVLLFAIQRFGTSLVGKVFGPITFVWFMVLGALGIYNIIKFPEIIGAANPYYAVQFFIANSWNGFLVLGSVFLVITGGEALYSDLGHFGRKPITKAWFSIVLPCLIINYFGQGALLLKNPEAVRNPFFLMAPNWALTPLVILATFATVIASQALITGVFSLTLQAVQSRFISRVRIVHTSEHERGQIYIRFMNNFLMISCVLLVLTFKTSSALASAYGIAVTMTMGITTLLFYYYLKSVMKWKKINALILCGLFIVIDIAFFGANIIKIMDGGWVPIAISIAIVTLMTTWRKGRYILELRLFHKTIPLEKFINKLQAEAHHVAPGTAIYLNGNIEKTPYALFHTYQHFKTIHERLIFLSVVTKEIPFVSSKEQIRVVKLHDNVYAVTVNFGYLESQDVPKAIDKIKLDEYVINADEVLYFLGKEKIFATKLVGMTLWREKIFSFLNHNALDATRHFNLPPKQVTEIGVQVEI